MTFGAGQDVARGFSLQRFFDFLLAGAGLMLLSPLLAATALAVRLSSRGSAFFAQQRVGLRGRLFQIRKFRTMVDGAPQLGTTVTASGDRRITPVGRLLRRAKLDELPQLYNVLRGDMSLVGPRPEVPEIVANYTAEMRRIFEIRPGITSLASLHLRDEEAILAQTRDPDRFYEEVLVPLKVRIALEHVDRASFWFDFRVLLQTVWMLTPLGRIWPVPAHPLVRELKRRLAEGKELLNERS